MHDNVKTYTPILFLLVIDFMLISQLIPFTSFACNFKCNSWVNIYTLWKLIDITINLMFNNEVQQLLRRHESGITINNFLWRTITDNRSVYKNIPRRDEMFHTRTFSLHSYRILFMYFFFAWRKWCGSAFPRWNVKQTHICHMCSVLLLKCSYEVIDVTDKALIKLKKWMSFVRVEQFIDEIILVIEVHVICLFDEIRRNGLNVNFGRHCPHKLLLIEYHFWVFVIVHWLK